MGAGENECQISQNYILQWRIQGRGPGGLGPPTLIFKPNWGPRGRKNFFCRLPPLPPSPLSKGLDDRPLLSQCLDTALSYTWNLQNFTCGIIILVKFDIHFLGLPWEIFFGVTTDDLLYLQPLKNVKKNAILFKLFCYKIFVHRKLKLLNFQKDSILTTFSKNRFFFFRSLQWMQNNR